MFFKIKFSNMHVVESADQVPVVGPTVVVVSSVHDGMLSLTHLTEPFRHMLEWKK